MDTGIDDELIERILLDFENAFKKDSLIDEFDILPVHESTRNKSPVIHVHNKLALEGWCLKPFYVYIYNKFFAWKLKKIKVDSHTILMWTKAILLINPELETAWNARKELISSEFVSTCYIRELKLSELVLSRKPKSSPVFAHRKWALLKMKDSPEIPEAIKQEFFVCSRAANLYSNNYYAWSHRTWIIQELLETCLKGVSEELTRTEFFVSSHISDHSGFHYRQFLLSCYRTVAPKLDPGNSYCRLHQIRNSLEEMENKKCFFLSTQIEKMLQFREAIQKEIAFLSDLQMTYSGHETLWYHRRYLLHEMENIMEENKETCAIQLESLDGAIQNKKHKLECALSVNWDLVKEENFLNHCVKETWEKTLIIRHLKWLNNVLKWPIPATLS